MFDDIKSGNTISSEFWQIRPHEKILFQKKSGLSKFLYLLFFRWFEKYRQFPQSLQEIPNSLIKAGLESFDNIVTIENISAYFQQEKRLYRYKKDIRSYFGSKIFNPECSTLQLFVQNCVLKEKNDEVVLEKIIDYLKTDNTEVPRNDILLKNIRHEKAKQEELFFQRIESLLTEDNKDYINNEILINDDEKGIQFLRQESSATGKESVNEEIKRLDILSKLPMKSFDFINHIHPKQINIYKRRFFTDTPERLQRRLDRSRYALTIIFCYQRHIQAIDSLVEHLLHYIHQIKKSRDKKKKKLDQEIGSQLNSIDQLYEVAIINRDNPKEIIEDIVYPTVPQKEIDQIISTRNLVKKTKKIIQETVVKGYVSNYRSVIFKILEQLEIFSNNQLLLDAIGLLRRYRQSKLAYYPLEEDIPINKLLSKKEQEKFFECDKSGNQRVLRKDYECAVLKLLRVKLRHKEAWIKGSHKYRDPEDDLPKDFTNRRDEYYDLLDVPLKAEDFIEKLKKSMSQHIKQFDNGFPANDLVSIGKKKGKPWIYLTPLKKVEEPKIVQQIKQAVLNKWGFIDLLDILKEVDLRENFTNCFTTAGNREILDRETIRKRLLMCLFAVGTNTGLKRAAGASRGVVSFEELRHIKKFFVNKDDLREACDTVVNAIFRIRNPNIWRSKSTACAADSKQFGCYNKNLLTEWSPRHHNDGVMIYWHVNDQYICVYSQLKSCTSSEVASMLQGILNQDTDMDIESQYVDSHGKSELGFALSYLEKFDLLPRYKTIGKQKIYLPSDDFAIKNINNITTRSIKWELIKDQYDEMVKYAVALKLGTSTAETVIRRFARSNYQHPTFKAFMELGKAVKSIFLCRYLHSVELRQQINAGLNVVENWNSANDFVFYGKSGEITSNIRDEQEISMLSLHLLQNCISYVNTLLIEELFKNNFWPNHLKKEDYRALNALFYLHINPYGTFELDLSKRLAIQQLGEAA
tara:strand:- start:764 stop:3691 length:2928 start_codon:yes stop_codon:yes gene_type:complete